MIPYIGDISKADAIVLASQVRIHTNILEFGCGASTQVISAYMPKDSIFISVDTEQGWIDKTKKNLELLEIQRSPTFYLYDIFFSERLRVVYDMIFVDGADNLRRTFALNVWDSLSFNGYMLFHDTRRGHDFRNLIEVAALHHNEIENIHLNVLGSNISIITKKVHQPYDNWQISEKKEPWMLGYGEPDVDYIKARLNQ